MLPRADDLSLGIFADANVRATGDLVCHKGGTSSHGTGNDGQDGVRRWVGQPVLCKRPTPHGAARLTALHNSGGGAERRGGTNSTQSENNAENPNSGLGNTRFDGRRRTPSVDRHEPQRQLPGILKSGPRTVAEQKRRSESRRS